MPVIRTSFRSNAQIVLVFAAVVLLAAQMLFVSQLFDAYGLLHDQNIRFWQRPFAYIGNIPKLLLVFVAIYVLLKHPAPGTVTAGLAGKLRPVRFSVFISAQLACFLILLLLTQRIFSQAEGVESISPAVFTCWVAAAAAVMGFWLGSLISAGSLLRFVAAEKRWLGSAAILSLIIFWLASETRFLWRWLADATLAASWWLLSGYDTAAVFIDPDSRELGIGHFVVTIAPACSGYEGIGLITGFTAVYLYVCRERFRFPQALMLLPLGAVLIWLMNCFRIAALIIIGDRWSPAVAVGGFHSNAGWIAFVLASLALLFVAGRSPLLLKAEKAAGEPVAINQRMALVIPFVALMAATLATGMFSSGFDYLYPVRVVAVAAAGWLVWRHLALRLPGWRAEPLLVGLAVAVVWIALASADGDTDTVFRSRLEAMAAPAAYTWIFFRLAGAILMAPFAEELAFRGYLLSRLSGVEDFVRGGIPFVPLACVASSITFGLLHESMLAGSIAGAAYTWVRLRSERIEDAIVSHVFTNTLIAGYALLHGDWSLL